MNNARCVLDTNVVVGAVLFKGSIARRALRKAITEGDVFISEAIITELTDVFNRPRFDKYLSLNTRTSALLKFLAATQILEVKESITACRDPKDDKFLELAVSAQANVLLSNDKDLLMRTEK